MPDAPQRRGRYILVPLTFAPPGRDEPRYLLVSCACARGPGRTGERDMRRAEPARREKNWFLLGSSWPLVFLISLCLPSTLTPSTPPCPALGAFCVSFRCYPCRIPLSMADTPLLYPFSSSPRVQVALLSSTNDPLLSALYRGFEDTWMMSLRSVCSQWRSFTGRSTGYDQLGTYASMIVSPRVWSSDAEVVKFGRRCLRGVEP